MLPTSRTVYISESVCCADYTHFNLFNMGLVELGPMGVFEVLLGVDLRV